MFDVKQFVGDPPKKLPGSQSGELIYIEDHSDVAIIGGGIFDGQGEHFWPYYHDPEKNGPKMFKAEHNKRCLIQGVTFKDSPNHNLVMYCDYMEGDHVTIVAPTTSHNTGARIVRPLPHPLLDSHREVVT